MNKQVLLIPRQAARLDSFGAGTNCVDNTFSLTASGRNIYTSLNIRYVPGRVAYIRLVNTQTRNISSVYEES